MSISKIFPTKWKVSINNHLIKKKIKSELKNTHGPRFLMIGTPLHGNVGDQAITMAQFEFLRNNYPDTSIVDIPQYYYNLFQSFISKYIRPNDIIVLNGGGYLGSQWIGEEHFVRGVVRKFPTNHIIIFPQTIYYEDTIFGKKELEESMRIYGNNLNFALCAREKISYEFMKLHYQKNTILFTPDIVLYLLNHMDRKATERNGVLFCFRKDKEKKVADEKIENWRRFVESKGFDIEDTDTVVPYNIFPENRETEVRKVLEHFSGAKLIVTDRLHGMIFAAITRTPCIVLSNSNHKVKGVYEWIRGLGYIKYLEDSSDFEKTFDELLEYSAEDHEIDLSDKFKPLKNHLASCLNHCVSEG